MNFKKSEINMKKHHKILSMAIKKFQKWEKLFKEQVEFEKFVSPCMIQANVVEQESYMWM